MGKTENGNRDGNGRIRFQSKRINIYYNMSDMSDLSDMQIYAETQKRRNNAEMQQMQKFRTIRWWTSG